MNIAPYWIERPTRVGHLGFAAMLAAVVVLLSVPAWAGRAEMRLLIEVSYYLALAQAWNLLAGYAGLVSVGQQAFVGLGCYGFIIATAFLKIPPLVAIPLTAFGVGLIAIPVAFLAFRLRGAHFAIGTWVLAEVLRLIFTLIKPFGAGTGMSLPIAVVRDVAENRVIRELILYYVSVAFGIGTVLLIFLWLRSRQGLALTAIRDSESAAGSIGINQQRTKLAVYLLAALIAGLVGSLVILEKLRTTPAAAFSVTDWSADVIFIVIIGGIGSVEGPIVGTLVFFALRFFLADFGAWYLITLGAIAIIVMLKAPRGLWGLIGDRLDVHFFPVQRQVRLGPQQANESTPLVRWVVKLWAPSMTQDVLRFRALARLLSRVYAWTRQRIDQAWRQLNRRVRIENGGRNSTQIALFLARGVLRLRALAQLLNRVHAWFQRRIGQLRRQPNRH
jgi:branched-chain amino acid transport system permease protein